MISTVIKSLGISFIFEKIFQTITTKNPKENENKTELAILFGFIFGSVLTFFLIKYIKRR